MYGCLGIAVLALIGRSLRRLRSLLGMMDFYHMPPVEKCVTWGLDLDLVLNVRCNVTQVKVFVDVTFLTRQARRDSAQARK